MNEIEYVVALVGIAIGVVLRTYAPYLKRLASGDVSAFDKKYLFSAVAAFMLALSTAYGAMGSLPETFGSVPWWVLLILSVLYGTTWNSAANRYVYK